MQRWKNKFSHCRYVEGYCKLKTLLYFDILSVEFSSANNKIYNLLQFLSFYNETGRNLQQLCFAYRMSYQNATTCIHWEKMLRKKSTRSKKSIGQCFMNINKLWRKNTAKRYSYKIKYIGFCLKVTNL